MDPEARKEPVRRLPDPHTTSVMEEKESGAASSALSIIPNNVTRWEIFRPPIEIYSCSLTHPASQQRERWQIFSSNYIYGKTWRVPRAFFSFFFTKIILIPIKSGYRCSESSFEEKNSNGFLVPDNRSSDKPIRPAAEKQEYGGGGKKKKNATI